MKKLLAILIVAVMIVGFTVPALAAPSVSTSVKGNDVTITVTDGGVTASKVVTFDKNKTVTYDVGGYTVQVEYNGGGVKSAKIVSSAPAAPAAPANNGNSGTQNNYIGGVGVKVDKNNANFHCNTFGGNGRVWPGEAIDANGKITKHDFKKTAFTFVFNSVPNTTKWTLDDVKDGNNSVGLVVCPECGSTQWISFSNNSGAPDGKNIQLQHPLVDIEIIKVWLDAEGDPIRSTSGLSARFSFAYEIGTNKGSKTLSPGKISVPAGTYTVSELLAQLSKNYTLIGVASDDFDIDNFTGTITITPAMALAGGKYSIEFTNKEDPHCIILKEWADGNPDGIVALFDIFEEDGETLVKADVKANEKVYVAPGTYIVREHLKEGYIEQEEQTVVVEENQVGTCTFVNAPVTYDGSLELLKSVNGTPIAFWELNGVKFADVADDMLFDLYKAVVDADGNPIGVGAHVAVGELGLEGNITFDWDSGTEKPNGWYVVVETFTPGSLADEIFADVDPLYILFVNGVAVGSGGFDEEALYELRKTADLPYVLGDSRLNMGGNVQELSVRAIDVEDAEWLSSFCANATSQMLGTVPYRVANELADPEALANAEAALNYIYNKYGSYDSFGGWGNGDKWDDFAAAIADYEDGDDEAYIELMSLQTRLLSQIAIWYFFNGVGDDIVYYSVKMGGIPDQYKIAIDDLLENGLTGKGELKLAYLVDANSEDEIVNKEFCQPQLVPYFGDITFENEINTFDGRLVLAKLVDGTFIAEWELDGIELEDVIDDMYFNLYEAIVDADGNPIGIGAHVAVGELSLEGNITFDWDTGFEKANGWYVVVETFEPGSLADQIFEDVGPLYVFFVDGVGVGGAKTDFDYEAFYTIVNGYGYGYQLGYGQNSELLNNNGDIFPIAIKTGDQEYPSFCANAGSTNFAGEGGVGCSGYYVLMSEVPNDVPYADFLKAYNYIEAEYGKLDDYRAVTQIVTWVLLDAIDIESEAFENINWAAVEAGTSRVKGVANAKEIVEDVIANYKDYEFNGDEEIVDVVFLVCDKHFGEDGHNFDKCQPQLVPVYGYNGFNNKTTTTEYDGTISVSIDVDAIEEYIVQTHKDATHRGPSGSIVSIIDADGDAQNTWGNLGYAWNNQHTAVTLDVGRLLDGEKLEFEMCVANKAQTPVGLSYFVELVDNKLVVTFGDNLVSGNFGADVYVTSPDKSNNPPSPKSAEYSNGEFFYATLPNSSNAFVFNGEAELWLYFKADNGSNIEMYAIIDGERVCVVDSVSGVQTRAYSGDILIEVSLDGGVTKVEFESLEYYGLFDVKYAPGTVVTVSVYINGEYFDEITLTTTDGEIEFEFKGTFTVNAGDPVKIVDCDYCNDWL